MIHSSIYNVLVSLVPCLIPPYAFRLSRSFGTQRIGWVLFASFSLLALMQVLRAWWPDGFGVEPQVALDLLNLLVPVLLLIGMVHIEAVFKERALREKEEQQLRQALELRVKERTAELDASNEELQREISLRKQGEAELKKSKERYRLLFEQNPQPMWVYDRISFKFLGFNNAALRFYGYNEEEFGKITAKELYPAADQAGFVAETAKALPPLRPRAVRRNLRKDGSCIEVELSAIDLNYGEYAARLVLVTDVTAERELQKQLLYNQKMAVTAQLAGGIADNLRQLIATIECDADSLLERFSQGGPAQALHRIAANAASLTALNRQLFALVRRHPMQAQTLDLNKLLENELPALPRLLGGQIKIDKMLWEGLPPIPADPELLRQIFHHLVVNARDAMPQGGSLTLCTAPVKVEANRAPRHSENRSGTFVCLTVADTGSGISAEAQAHLFEPFFTTKDPTKSAGLGLATVQGLVKQHSGWIEVASQPGEGSRFSVFFPSLHSPGPAQS